MRARGGQARLQAVALTADLGQLLEQQLVGALEFLVPQQQSVDAIGKVLQRGHGASQRGFARS